MSAPKAFRQNTSDPYQWLEVRDAPEVLAYLQAENAYVEEQMAECSQLQQELFEEIRTRIVETDLSLPLPWQGYLYYQRTQQGDEYPRYFRCRQTALESLEVHLASEQLLLDLNELAQGDYCELGAFSLSPDQRLLAYSLDRAGDEVFDLYVKDLGQNSLTALPFVDCAGPLIWANDNQTLFFITLDACHRPYRLYRYRLGSDEAVLVFEERDERFFLSCERSGSERQLIVHSASKTTSEVWVLNADHPEAPWQCLAPRQDQHEYDCEHAWLEGRWQWLIRSNQQGLNFALYAADEGAPRSHWRCLRAHQEHCMIEAVAAKAQGYLLCVREEGLSKLWVQPEHQPGYWLALPDAVYSLDLDELLAFDSPYLRLRYESLQSPAQIRQLQLCTGEQQLLKQTQVLGAFCAEDYQSLRLWVKARDGARIALTLVARREVLERGTAAPLYLYGYGAYGECLDPWFSHARLSLLERGFIFAIAHVRGGGELGEAWYRAGKLEHKENTFSDFIACAEYLIEQGFTSSPQLVISGASAGGLLIGAVLNKRPELFAAAIAEVPFVDLLNTMLRPELPLTVTEYEEWGDPREPEVYQRLKGYSPYDNISAQSYPAILALAGYHDSRVQYWEAAKWLAKLRAHQQGDALLLLKTDLDSGHGGSSGRYQALHEVALEYAFILSQLRLV